MPSALSGKDNSGKTHDNTSGISTTNVKVTRKLPIANITKDDEKLFGILPPPFQHNSPINELLYSFPL
jgi:hypothetical protein